MINVNFPWYRTTRIEVTKSIRFTPPNLISLIAADRAILSGPFHKKLYITVLSYFIKSCEAGRTENTKNIFGGKKDLIIY